MPSLKSTASKKSNAEGYIKTMNDHDISFESDNRTTSGETKSICSDFKAGWACYPKNQTQKPMLPETMKQLIQLWEAGHKDKSANISPERASIILFDSQTGPLRENWEEQLNVVVAKIKAFFAKSATEMKKFCATIGS